MSRLCKETEATENRASHVAAKNGSIAKSSTALQFDEMLAASSNLSLPTPTWALHRVEAGGFIDAVFIDVATKHIGYDEF